MNIQVRTKFLMLESVLVYYYIQHITYLCTYTMEQKQYQPETNKQKLQTNIQTTDTTLGVSEPEQQTQIPHVPQQATYEQAGVPAVEPTDSGKTQGIIALISAILSLLFVPVLFGFIGIVLGILSYNKGQKTLGMTAIILSAIFLVIGILLGIYVITHPELFETTETVSGALLLFLIQ